MKSRTVSPEARKIIAAILVILVAAGAAYLIVNGMNAGSANQRSRADNVDVINISPIANENADKAPIKMTPSEWDKLVAIAIEQRCPIEGMTREQVESAFGKPNSSTTIAGKGEVWRYEQEVQGECIRYEVAKCIEHLLEHQVALYYFTPSGHLTYPSQDGLFHPNCLVEPFYSRYFKPLEH